MQANDGQRRLDAVPFDLERCRVCVLLVAIFEVLAILMLLAAFSAAARADDLAGDR